MSLKIYKSNFTLVAQPGRSVATFPSGLVRVEQTYLGLTARSSVNRAALAIGQNMPDGNSSPCTDGLKIFPEVQEVRREDGFTEYKVCAYGRVNTTGNKTFSKELGKMQLFASFASAYGTSILLSENSLDVTCDALIWKFVSPKTASPDVRISDSLKTYRLNGQALSSVSLSEFFSTLNLAATTQPTQVEIPQLSAITLAECQNYGHVDEWTVCYKALPAVVQFGSWQRTAAPSRQDLIFSYKSPGPNVWPGQINLCDVTENGSSVITVGSVLNNLTFIPLTNTETATYLGGSARVTENYLYYTPPNPVAPSPVTVKNSTIPPAPFELVVGKFTFRHRLKEVREDSSNKYYDYVWDLMEVFEFFNISINNENNQGSEYRVQIKFAEFENAS
jgi:hypothetical protein